MDNENARFKYNLPFEIALSNLLGERYLGSASEFRDITTCKEYFRRAIKRIKKTLNDIIVYDERLLMMTNRTLERLDELAKETSQKNNHDWLIIANLIDLISRLIGYDWADGKIHRYVFYHQNRIQEIEDYHKMAGRSFFDELRNENKIRYELVCQLKEKGFSNNYVGRILRISDKRVSKILKLVENTRVSQQLSETNA